eukprot:3224570-Rhodomonas_salina.1
MAPVYPALPSRNRASMACCRREARPRSSTVPAPPARFSRVAAARFAPAAFSARATTRCTSAPRSPTQRPRARYLRRPASAVRDTWATSTGAV